MRRRRTGGKLEVLRRVPDRDQGKPPLLLVHGGWHGAWCWDRGFMARLAGRGHEVVAVSLRGHGQSWGQGPVARRTHGIAGYVADVEAVAVTLPSAPVVVGHSMGGLVVQRYLAERRRAKAGILLAPLPASGVLGFTLRLLRSDPVAVARVFATLSCRPVVGDVERASRLLFGGKAARDKVDSLFPLLGDESFRAFLELLAPGIDLSKVDVPVAVLTAGDDAVFTAREGAATAAAFSGRPVIFDGMAHDMMLDPGWERVADWVADFGGSSAKLTPSQNVPSGSLAQFRGGAELEPIIRASISAESTAPVSGEVIGTTSGKPGGG